jgi:hypothetical protein
VIQSSEDSISARLTEMERQGFLKTVVEGEYRYAPASDDIAQSVTDLRTAYLESRVRVIEAIFSERTDVAARIADSFRAKKDR